MRPCAPAASRFEATAFPTISRESNWNAGMSSFLTYLALAVMLAVVAVLVAGLRNMLVGGPGNRSQKLMRLRVMLQAIAVLIIVIFLVFAR